MSQDASFEPSTINIGSGVRPVDVRKKKGKEGREERWLGLDYALKGNRSVIFHACAEKSPVYLSLPKFVHELTIPT